MPDRRQGDRRASSGMLGKKLSIPLSTFVFIVTIVLIILASIMLCKFFNTKGYDLGYSDGYSDALSDMGFNSEVESENTVSENNIIE